MDNETQDQATTDLKQVYGKEAADAVASDALRATGAQTKARTKIAEIKNETETSIRIAWTDASRLRRWAWRARDDKTADMATATMKALDKANAIIDPNRYA